MPTQSLPFSEFWMPSFQVSRQETIRPSLCRSEALRCSPVTFG
jgi:hypothetical protein